jgi:hypothetical protein
VTTAVSLWAHKRSLAHHGLHHIRPLVRLRKQMIVASTTVEYEIADNAATLFFLRSGKFSVTYQMEYRVAGSLRTRKIHGLNMDNSSIPVSHRSQNRVSWSSSE